MKWNFDTKNYNPNEYNIALTDEISSVLFKYFPEQRHFNVNIQIDRLKPIHISFRNPEVE